MAVAGSPEVVGAATSTTSISGSLDGAGGSGVAVGGGVTGCGVTVVVVAAR